jgi:hypothetical protein
MSAKRLKALESVRDFNEKFKIGQKVYYQGEMYKLWSQAGLSTRDEPVVFLDSKTIVEPVPITQLEIEGWDVVYGKRAKKKS